MRYRIALCGFSDFEQRAMDFSFRQPRGAGEAGCDVVATLGDADFAVVDADSRRAVEGLIRSGRLAQAVFVGGSAPPGAAAHLPRPIDPRRILQALQALASDLDPREPSAQGGGAESPMPQPLHAAPVEAPSAATPLADARAAARAATRRARLLGARGDGAPLEPLRGVLVIDADPVARAELCLLLQRFGFEPRAVPSVPRAEHVATSRPFAAIFLDIALDDTGVALLQRLRALPAPPGHAGPALLMMAARLDPAERVRAALVGIDAPLTKPLARGDVARALESAGVTLPADARRL